MINDIIILAPVVCVTSLSPTKSASTANSNNALTGTLFSKRLFLKERILCTRQLKLNS